MCMKLSHRRWGFAWCMRREPLEGNGKSGQERDTGERERDCKGGLDTDHICLKDPGKHVRWEDIMQF